MKDYYLKSWERWGCIGFLLTLSLFFFPSPGVCFVRGDINFDDKIGLPEAINALQVTASLRSQLSAKTINVPGDFATIQQAINEASKGDTILVAAGSYTENLTIAKDHITLQGAGKELTILNGGTNDAIIIDGARGFLLQGLKVQGGAYGIYGRKGSVFEVRDAIVQDTTDNGILASQSSFAIIRNTTVLRSGNHGVSIYQNSGAILRGAIVISDNANIGLAVNLNSSGRFLDATLTINGNGGRGIYVNQASSLLSSASSVTMGNNTGETVFVYGGSSLGIDSDSHWAIESGLDMGLFIGNSSSSVINANGTLISRDNADNGIAVSSGSSLAIHGSILLENNTNAGLSLNLGAGGHISGTGSVTVRGTQGTGVNLNGTATLRVWGALLIENSAGTDGHGLSVIRNSNVAFTVHDGSPLSVKIRNNARYGARIIQQSNGRLDIGTEITGNGASGLRVEDDSLVYATGIKVQNNSGWGVYADDGSSVNVQNSTISENALGDVTLKFGSRGRFSGNTIGILPITCESTVLSRGDQVCP